MEGQKIIVAKVRILGEIVEERLGHITEAILWGRDPVWDAEDYAEWAEDYAEWAEEWDEEEMERDIAELREESSLYQDFLKEVLGREELETDEGNKEVEGGDKEVEQGDKEIEQVE